jgi:hypothetical protein
MCMGSLGLKSRKDELVEVNMTGGGWTPSFVGTLASSRCISCVPVMSLASRSWRILASLRSGSTGLGSRLCRWSSSAWPSSSDLHASRRSADENSIKSSSWPLMMMARPWWPKRKAFCGWRAMMSTIGMTIWASSDRETISVGPDAGRGRGGGTYPCLGEQLRRAEAKVLLRNVHLAVDGDHSEQIAVEVWWFRGRGLWVNRQE